MQASVPRDIGERFSDQTAAQKWYANCEREVYSLMMDDDLAGVVWFDVRPRPDLDAEYTFAIRLYESSRGKGLSYDFALAARTDMFVYRSTTGVWLETDEDNVPGLKLYEKLGYKIVDNKNGRQTLVFRA